MALWGGRFSKDTDRKVAQFSESVSYDQRLYSFDIQGSIVHATMLARVGVISEADAESIRVELQAIRERIDEGTFPFAEELEDVHMNIESALIEALGPVGARLHTG
ncbi:MAG: argininosuccinate lyase, partial [Lentisphaeria bacterium]|nr:argininosuccinate lyase [Lentisphaeria bacterium]